MKDSIRFLKRIFAQTAANIELRCLPSGHRLFTRNWSVMENFLRSHLQENVFFGAATRKKNSGNKAGCAEVTALWVDLDWKQFKRGWRGAIECLVRFPLPPSIVVFTGHGFHLYWPLEKPIVAGLYVEAYLKGLASALNGDRAAAELARILRVPGTFNYKARKIAVKCIKLSQRRYLLSDFKRWEEKSQPRVEPAIVDFKFNNTPVDIERLRLSLRIKELIKTGWTGDPYKSRSEADMAVIAALLRVGVSPDQIHAIFCQYTIGEKYREMENRGDAYLRRSIEKAMAFLKQKGRRI